MSATSGLSADRLGLPSALYLFAVIMASCLCIAFFIEKLALSMTKEARRHLVPSSLTKPLETSSIPKTSQFFWWTEALPIFAHLINIAALIISTCYITYYHINYPPAGLLVMVCGVVLMMKLASYCMVNFSLRQQYAHGVRDTYAALYLLLLF